MSDRSSRFMKMSTNQSDKPEGWILSWIDKAYRVKNALVAMSQIIE
jgi:hypothetical protein